MNLYVTYHPSHRHWVTMFDYTFEINSIKFTIPAHFKTDLATIPRIFWPIIGPHELGIRASVKHDFLYRVAKIKRKRADDIFLLDMEKDGVTLWKRRAAYRAVRIFGWIKLPWGYGANN